MCMYVYFMCNPRAYKYMYNSINVVHELISYFEP